MAFFTGTNGDKSSKRLGGLSLIWGGLILGFLIAILNLPTFISLVIAMETIGASLLGVSMLERKL